MPGRIGSSAGSTTIRVDRPTIGSGTCATYAAARARGLTDGPVRIDLDGGPLWMDMDADGAVLMTGAASLSFHGIIDPGMLTGAAA